MRFSGMRAIVTRGASGIGQALAQRIMTEGDQVSIWDLNDGINVDIADSSSVANALKQIIAAMGGVDILVNSAAITGPTVPVTEFPEDGGKK